MQKSFYCIFMKSTQGTAMSSFVESIFANIQNSTQTSGDSTASFMYSFNINKEVVVGIYTSDTHTKIPSFLTMYSNSLNNEANMMGAVFDTLDSSSSVYEQSVFRNRIAESLPFYVEILNNILGTDTDPNANKEPVAASEPTDDIFSQGIESFENHVSEGIEEPTTIPTSHKEIETTPRKEVALLEEILDKLNDVVTSISVLNDKMNRLEEKVSNSTETTTHTTTASQVSKEINNIGGIPEIPTYEEEPSVKQEPEVEEQPATTTKPVTEETVNTTPDEGLEVTTPSEASIYTPEKSTEAEQSSNAPTPVITTNLTPDVSVTEEKEEAEGTESLDVTLARELIKSTLKSKDGNTSVPLTQLAKIKKLMEYSDGTESSLHNYIISNSHMLDKSDIELYCTYDFEESIKSNNLVKLDRVTSIKRQLETKMI